VLEELHREPVGDLLFKLRSLGLPLLLVALAGILLLLLPGLELPLEAGLNPAFVGLGQ
jgi:hypothetical protein